MICRVFYLLLQFYKKFHELLNKIASYNEKCESYGVFKVNFYSLYFLKFNFNIPYIFLNFFEM